MTESTDGQTSAANADGPQELTRDELYAMVWREPMLRIGERFGVSSSYLTRVCISLRVPRPPLGHWTKIEFGLDSPQLPLAAAKPGDPLSWTPPVLREKPERKKKLSPPALQASETVASDVAVTSPEVVSDEHVEAGATDGEDPAHEQVPPDSESAEEAAGERIVVRRSRRIPPGTTHDLLKKAKPHFLKTRGHDSGLLRPFKRLLVDIIVSEALLDDTLELANQLFLRFTSRGHHVTIPSANAHAHRMAVDEREAPKPVRYRSQVWVPDRPTVVYIDEVPIGLTFYEMTEDTEMVYVNGDYLPVKSLTPAQALRYRGVHHWTTTRTFASGRRCLQVYSPHFRYSWHKRWKETKPCQLAKWLPEVVKELEAVIPEMKVGIAEAEVQAKEEQRKREEEWEEYRAKERREHEAKAREEARADLMKAIEGWDEARRIAAYFDSVQSEVAKLERDDREHLAARLALARGLIGELDPLALLSHWDSPDERVKAQMEHDAWLYRRDR